MKATIESTFQYQAALEWSVPSRWAPQLRADLDELQMHRAAQQPVPDPDKAQAMVKRALHAGATKTERLHDAIDAVIEAHRPGVEKWTGSRRSRAEWLKRLIGEGAPGWRTIDDHLKTLSL